MQSIAILVLLVAFCGACMAQEDDTCDVSKEEIKISMDCLNKTKGGELNYEFLIEDPDYLSEEESCEAIMCVMEAKKYITSERECDTVAMKKDIDTVVTASEKKRTDLKKALDQCIKDNTESENPICASMECFSSAYIDVCDLQSQ